MDISSTVNSLVSEHPWGTTKWSLTGGGRLSEVVAMRELTVISSIQLTWRGVMANPE